MCSHTYNTIKMILILEHVKYPHQMCMKVPDLQRINTADLNDSMIFSLAPPQDKLYTLSSTTVQTVRPDQSSGCCLFILWLIRTLQPEGGAIRTLHFHSDRKWPSQHSLCCTVCTNGNQLQLST